MALSRFEKCRELVCHGPDTPPPSPPSLHPPLTAALFQYLPIFNMNFVENITSFKMMCVLTGPESDAPPFCPFEGGHRRRVEAMASGASPNGQ